VNARGRPATGLGYITKKNNKSKENKKYNENGNMKRERGNENMNLKRYHNRNM
jgi:hypothetical protein